MKKILAFGASTSSKSINKRLATYVASLVEDADVEMLDLNDFEMPLYSIDREAVGIPEPAIRFKKYISDVDGIIISFAEHNGSYAAGFKNILDWASRVEKGMWMEKPMLLLSTSPGGRGGARVLEIAKNSYQYMNGQVVGSLAVPSFNDNFSDDAGITNPEISSHIQELIAKFKSAM